ncbi:DUF4339 domain-containing protein, partial [Bradyrhizobium sp. SHOUNA76]|uniref:DUF4339 domain-containing protein n=1 Tax=Bradyrhizobium sp. SHOUNA76 TaxID=2908927 RepID=UPI001FF32D52
MASWFYASEGKQQGPFPEGQFRDLVAQGVVRPDTLVWTEGNLPQLGGCRGCDAGGTVDPVPPCRHDPLAAGV